MGKSVIQEEVSSKRITLRTGCSTQRATSARGYATRQESVSCFASGQQAQDFVEG